MANRQQTQDQQQRGRKPMQTSPDDDEAQVADQSQLTDDETERDEITEDLPVDRKRRALQPSQEREGERLAQPGDEAEEADDQEDLDDEDEDDEDEEKENLSGM